MKKIIWKDIPNYEGFYQINNLGEIKSLYNYRGKNNILKNKLKKKIIQYDINGNKIQTFNSIAEASRKTNTNITGISKCINKKRKTSNNYIWVYESVVMPNA